MVKNPTIPEHFRICQICTEEFEWRQPKEQNRLIVDKHVTTKSNQDASHPRTRSEKKNKNNKISSCNRSKSNNQHNSQSRNCYKQNYNHNHYRLPVISKECQHFLCYGCLLQQRATQSEGVQIRKIMSCPFCKAKGAFRPDSITFNTVLMEWIKTTEEEEIDRSSERISDGERGGNSNYDNNPVFDHDRDEEQNKVVIEIRKNSRMLKSRFREVLFKQLKKLSMTCGQTQDHRTN